MWAFGGSNGCGKKFARWEVMAMARAPLQRHYCTSAQPLPLPIQRVGTNQPGDLRMMISGVEAGDEEHRLLHVGLSAGIKGLILAKHIGVINSRSACPIPQRASGACCISTTTILCCIGRTPVCKYKQQILAGRCPRTHSGAVGSK